MSTMTMWVDDADADIVRKYAKFEAELALQWYRGLGRPELTPGCNACRRNAGTSCASCSRTPWRTWSI